MTAGNEVSIGAVLADGTEKPEAAVMRTLAPFVRALSPHLKGMEAPPVTVVTSQAAQLSAWKDQQLEAQKTALRVLAYDLQQPAVLLAENQLAHLGQPRLVIVPSPQALTEVAWQALLAHADAGGTVLVTGAFDRDEHGRRTDRLSRLYGDARAASLVHREATLRLPEGTFPLSFGPKRQAALESIEFADHVSLRELPRRRGRLFLAAQPIELAEARDATRALYAHLLRTAGVTSPSELGAPLPPGVLVYPVALADAVLYVLASERNDDVDLSFTDRATRARLALRLRAGRAALALIRRSDGAILARTGF
jgi:hypothetical protein